MLPRVNRRVRHAQILGVDPEDLTPSSSVSTIQTSDGSILGSQRTDNLPPGFTKNLKSALNQNAAKSKKVKLVDMSESSRSTNIKKDGSFRMSNRD